MCAALCFRRSLLLSPSAVARKLCFPQHPVTIAAHLQPAADAGSQRRQSLVLQLARRYSALLLHPVDAFPRVNQWACLSALPLNSSVALLTRSAPRSSAMSPAGRRNLFIVRFTFHTYQACFIIALSRASAGCLSLPHARRIGMHSRRSCTAPPINSACRALSWRNN